MFTLLTTPQTMTLGKPFSQAPYKQVAPIEFSGINSRRLPQAACKSQHHQARIRRDSDSPFRKMSRSISPSAKEDNKISVTVDMYSGRENPSWVLSPEKAENFLTLLGKRKGLIPENAFRRGLLGYRGMIVERRGTSSILFDSRIDPSSEIESHLLENSDLPQDVKDYVGQQIDVKSIKSPGQPYNPGKWNDMPNVRRNNCYNYGTNKQTNTFAQPGYGSGQIGPMPPNCPETGKATERDGLIRVDNPDGQLTKGWHCVQLFIADELGFKDYHYFKKHKPEEDKTEAQWSHKPGQDFVRNTDNSGKLISDPKTCDRGPYKEYCGTFRCNPSTATIGGPYFKDVLL